MTQPQQKPYLTYALDADSKLIHIDSVSTGLACKCFCPHCKSELVAKNGGSRKVHHFAHANGSDCVGAIESALHINLLCCLLFDKVEQKSELYSVK